MARPIKKGLDYFPLDVTFGGGMEDVYCEYGKLGEMVIISLWQRIYRESYYIEYNEKKLRIYSNEFCGQLKELFGGDGRTGREIFNDIVLLAADSGIFDRGLLEREGILTSKKIQKIYIEAKKKSKSGKIDEKFRIDDGGETARQEGSEFSGVFSEFSTQSKVKKSKVKKSKVKKSSSSTEDAGNADDTAGDSAAAVTAAALEQNDSEIVDYECPCAKDVSVSECDEVTSGVSLSDNAAAEKEGGGVLKTQYSVNCTAAANIDENAAGVALGGCESNKNSAENNKSEHERDKAAANKVADNAADSTDSGGNRIADNAADSTDSGGNRIGDNAADRTDSGGNRIADNAAYSTDSGGSRIADNAVYSNDSGGNRIGDNAADRNDSGGSRIGDNAAYSTDSDSLGGGRATSVGAELERVLRAYEKNIGSPTDNVRRQIGGYLVKGVEARLIARLAEYSAEQGKPTWQYLDAAIGGNLAQGIRTLDDYEKSRRERARQRQRERDAPKYGGAAVRGINNYVDTNKPDYSGVFEDALRGLNF